MYWYFKWAEYWSDPGFSQNQRTGSLIANNYIPDKTGSVISKAWRGGNQSNFLNNLRWEQRICILEEKLKKMFLAVLILSEKKSYVWIREMENRSLKLEIIIFCVCYQATSLRV